MSSTKSLKRASSLGFKPAWLWVAGCAVLLLAAVSMAPDTADEHIGYMLRVTARVAFVLLLLAYVARPLTQLLVDPAGVGPMLLRGRRQIGLAMALAHTVHFVYVVAYLRFTPGATELITLVFGGAAFLFMWVMALTSNRASMRQLGPWWRRIHLVGLHYLWLIFMQSFVPRALTGDFLYIALVVAGSAALLLRVLAYRRQSRVQAAKRMA